jgi:hypothetical protein
VASVYCDFVTVLRLLFLAGQKDTKRPFDGAGTITVYGLAAVIPGLGPFEIRVASHEGAGIFGFILTIATLPGS